MAARKGGLGKGFEALMQSNTMDDELGEKATLSINDIEPNRGQPRKTTINVGKPKVSLLPK